MFGYNEQISLQKIVDSNVKKFGYNEHTNQIKISLLHIFSIQAKPGPSVTSATLLKFLKHTVKFKLNKGTFSIWKLIFLTTAYKFEEKKVTFFTPLQRPQMDFSFVVYVFVL